MSEPLELTVASSIRQIGQSDWDGCACPEAATGSRPQDPFTTFRFLAALEDSGSVGPGTGWAPRPLVLRRAGEIIAVAPAYLKSHSQGEYIFDFNWAEAWQRAGGAYYPKLQVAVPFTPVTGRRILAKPGFEAEAQIGLMDGLVQLCEAQGLSSAHLTFCTKLEAELGESAGLLRRASQQFHWENPGYKSFDDFLAQLSSRKRKAIRRERAEAQGFGGRILALSGADIRPQHWDAFWAFYQDTGSRKWGTPYLTRRFFDLIGETMAEDILLILAEEDGEFIAGALNFIGRDCLYGRYWGATRHHPFLHFELCYYQAIDYAIAHGLRLEAGAQGEHKLARGYLPAQTHSLHYIANPSFRRAVAEFVRAEASAVEDDIEILTAYGPFRRTQPLED